MVLRKRTVVVCISICMSIFLSSVCLCLGFVFCISVYGSAKSVQSCEGLFVRVWGFVCGDGDESLMAVSSGLTRVVSGLRVLVLGFFGVRLMVGW